MGRWPRPLLIAVVLSALAVLAPRSAHAHTEFDFSLPAAGESVDAPLEKITIAFTLPVTIVGNGFEVLTPDGEIVEPAVTTADDREFTLTLDPPLSGGDVGVRYEVRAEDGHVLAEGFAFAVGDAPLETTVPTSSPAPTSTPATEASDTSAPQSDSVATTDATPPVTTAPPETVAAPPPEENAAEPNAADPASATTSDDGDDGGTSVAIWAAMGVIVVGAGAFLFVRARRAE